MALLARELHVHCYRSVGSLEDAEDMVQATILRAWRKRSSFAGRSAFRAWLYRIARNACLDFLERRPARVLAPEASECADVGRATRASDEDQAPSDPQLAAATLLHP